MNHLLKKGVAVSLLLFWLNVTFAENLADKISRYSEKDELAAQETMNESCSKSDKADKELLDLTKKVNSSLDRDIAEKRALSPDSENAFKALENFNHADLKKLQADCLAARNNYERILKVREHAYIEAERIDREGKEREMEQLRNTQIQPAYPSTTNCTSNVVGQTVYTRCNSY